MNRLEVGDSLSSSTASGSDLIAHRDDGMSDRCEDDFVSRISQVLDLDDSAESKIIVNQLMFNGRQGLIVYEDDIPGPVYREQMSNDHSELLKLLKCYVETQLQSNNEEWLRSYLAEQKKTSPALYDQMLTCTADYGSKLRKDNHTLSLMIQSLFELNTEAFQPDKLFDQIWHTLTIQGCQGAKQYSDYISTAALRDQLERDQSPLYLAVRESYREPLENLFRDKDGNITKPQVAELALDCVTKDGWRKGLNDEKIKDLLSKKKHIELIEKLDQYLRSTTSSIELKNETIVEPIASAVVESPVSPSLSSIDIANLVANETEMVLMCVAECEKLQLSNLVEAGELLYTNKTFTDVLDQIIQDFRVQENFATFIRSCSIPVMYLLKRHQSLDDFIGTLFFKYSKVQLTSGRAVDLSFRMIIHILLLISDLPLSRMIMSLLSKRNSVPFLEPTLNQETYSLVFDIIHVWDYSTPTILSFGIGKCLGKSVLLNTLFMSSFEQSTESVYFQKTIDIDFGYSFLPRRSTNIADTHGMMSKELLTQIHELFDGFVIHIEHTYLLNNFDLVKDLLSVVSAATYRLIIIRDVPISSTAQCSALLSSRLSSIPSIETFVLPNIADQNNKQNKHAILTLRDKIFERLPDRCSRDPAYLKNKLKQLMNSTYRQHLDSTYDIVKGLEIKLIEAARDDHKATEYFPEYFRFVELCGLQMKLAHFNFYGTENDTMVYDTRRKIFELEDATVVSKHNSSVVFNLFTDVLKAPDMLTCLEFLISELKLERARLLSTNDMAQQVPIHKTLSLEVLWRNAIVCSQYQSLDVKQFLHRKYCECIVAGYPFEIIDGDNFYFQHDFLLQTLAPFVNKRTLVISVIGPQNSGKSTLLNYMFGTLFDVRDGRCTRGIYGSFVKSNLPQFDYIMLIDTEGILSTENNQEYDRRIVLFCLAVSHIVIVNMAGEVTTTVQNMLTLCTDSLKKMGVTRIPQPVVHFVLNQKADLNIENNQAAIDHIISEFKKFNLRESVDIRKETFHTLPSAFKKEGQTLTSNMKLPNAIKTEPDFIERVQLLCGEIIRSVTRCSTRSFEFSDPLQWLQSSITIFDTLQKFSDLTYYQDINERRLDNEIRDHIRNDLTRIFTSEYQDQLIIESSGKTDDEIGQLFETKQHKTQETAEQKVENLFQQLKAPDTIRNRSRQFLRTQIIAMFNALCTNTIAVNERKKVRLLVENGEGALKKLINDTIDRGIQMSPDDASEAVDQMFDNTIKHIQNKFVPDLRLKQALNHMYTNYHIYEKECLLDFHYITDHLPLLSGLNESQTSIADLKDKFISYFSNLAYKDPSVTSHHFNPKTKVLYSFDIIKNLVYLNRELLAQQLNEYVSQNTSQIPQYDDHNQRDGSRNRNESPFPNASDDVVSPLSDNEQEPPSATSEQRTVTSTEAFQMNIRNAIQEQKPLVLSSSTIDERNMILAVSKLIEEIYQRILKNMGGNDQNEVRQIRTELIQKIVGSVNSLIIEIDNELSPFCLTLSSLLKSSFHLCALIVLTKYYYDEQRHHFTQTLAEMTHKKNELKNYFINMVVPNADVDTNYAVKLANEFKEHLIKKLVSDGQEMIKSELKLYESLDRKWIQTRCDELLLANEDERWHMSFVESPTMIIEQHFEQLWINIRDAINQKLADQKSYYSTILTQLYHCLHGMHAIVHNLGSAAIFVDDIFRTEESNSLDAHQNLINKKRCMSILLYKYLTGEQIPSTYDVQTKTYRLKEDTLESFQLLADQHPPTEILKTTVQEIVSTFDSISIGNLVAFLESLLKGKDQIENEFNQVKNDFDSMDTQDTHARLLDRVRGCPDRCPCCKRPCDVDHTQIKSRPGSQYNEHRCTSGHALRAMNGYKFETTEEASLLMCDQIRDEQILVIDSVRCRWSQFKADHSDWNFQSALNDRELNRLHGKFLVLWEKVGRDLCERYGMKFVTHNTSQKIAHESFHYVLLLDGSGSMNGGRWKDLLKAVEAFIAQRRALNTTDHITIIVFADAAQCTYFNQKINDIDVSTIQYPDGGTNFPAAFTCVHEHINRSKRGNANDNYAVVFMSDGEDQYPEKELDKLLQAHGSVIKRFWTLSLRDECSSTAETLIKINKKMNGSFYDVEKSIDLIQVYAEVASASNNNTSNQ